MNQACEKKVKSNKKEDALWLKEEWFLEVPLYQKG